MNVKWIGVTLSGIVLVSGCNQQSAASATKTKQVEQQTTDTDYIR